jgi:hypothetical protein
MAPAKHVHDGISASKNYFKLKIYRAQAAFGFLPSDLIGWPRGESSRWGETKMLRRISLILFAGLAVAACDLTPPGDALDFAKSYIALFRARDFAEIEKRTAPSSANQQFRTNIEKMAAMVPNEDPKNITVIGWNKFMTDGKLVSVRASFEYEFSSTWLVVTITLAKKGDGFLVAGANFTPHKDSLQNLTKFTLSNKPLGSYLFLIYAAALPFFMIFAAILAIQTPIPKWKWLWVAFTLFGFFQTTLNWTTGEFAVKFLSFQFLGSGYAADTYSPVLITASLPLGAIIFLQRRRQWLRRAATSAAANVMTTPPAEAGS